MFPNVKQKLAADLEAVVNKDYAEAIYFLGLDDDAMSQHLEKAIKITLCPEQVVM